MTRTRYHRRSSTNRAEVQRVIEALEHGRRMYAQIDADRRAMRADMNTLRRAMGEEESPDTPPTTRSARIYRGGKWQHR